MRAQEFVTEAAIGVKTKRPARKGSRPDRGHSTKERYNVDGVDESARSEKVKKITATLDNMMQKAAANTALQKQQAIDKKKARDDQQGQLSDVELAEHGKASRRLCTSTKSDADLGASQLASCKSQGLRPRDGNKSHLTGHGSGAKRIKVGGKKLKGAKYGGDLPSYGSGTSK